MEPQVQYVRSHDGESIAYWTMGEGTPLMALSSTGPTVGIPLANMPARQQWYELLTAKRRVVHYDPRGYGLSSGRMDDMSLDGHSRDLEAVADDAGLQSFALFAPSRMGPVAIAYAARHPERVSHLILFCAAVRGADLWSPRAEVLLRLAEEDWELFTETVAHDNLGWSSGPEARQWAAWLRETSSAAQMRRTAEMMKELDASQFLSQVRSPTLVLHRRQVRRPAMAVARTLAAEIPGARLLVLEGTSATAASGDAGAVLSAINEFLGRGEAETEAPAELPSGMTAILFADIADSTGLTERMGDAAFRAKARELDGALRAAIRERGGTPVEGKLLGDGVLAVFTSAREAIEAALACGDAGASAGLPLHLGIHAGDVIREKDPDGRDNVYGGAVNIASRIAGLSAAGEVLVSETVRSLARTSAGVRFEDRGEQELKGVGERVRVWAVATQVP